MSIPAAVSTDAPSATLGAEAVNLSWSPVTGAQGYAIFVSTTTPPSYNTYWLATSTNGVPNTTFTYNSTSTPLSGSYTKEDTTAFSNRLMGDGSKSFPNAGSIGIGTSTLASSTPMDVNGYMRAGRDGTSTAARLIRLASTFTTRRTTTSGGATERPGRELLAIYTPERLMAQR